jgi:transcriptional regulator of acetoin/glycerol metabolism
VDLSVELRTERRRCRGFPIALPESRQKSAGVRVGSVAARLTAQPGLRKSTPAARRISRAPVAAGADYRINRSSAVAHDGEIAVREHSTMRDSNRQSPCNRSGGTAIRTCMAATMHDMTCEGDILLAAQTGVPVLITAESRELRAAFARLIHANGTSGNGPFVVFGAHDVAADAEGSSRSASALACLVLCRRFDEARGGTLFIDDIATFSVDEQTELFSLLEGEVRPRSSTRHRTTPRVRIVAGASRHLGPARARGAFCERLFYRLNVIHIDLIRRRPASTSLSKRTM